ncbi:MAG: hypothetical protein AAF519_14985 [Bacteroidota bacterium]
MKNFWVLSILLFLFTSCEITQLNQPEDDNSAEVIQAPTELPSSSIVLENEFHGGGERVWETISFTFMGVGGIQDCRLDDQMTINVDGTYTYDGGSTLCGAEDSERMRTGTWEVTNDGRNIIFDAGTVDEYTADVTGLDNDMIAISGQYIGLDVSGVYRIK